VHQKEERATGSTGGDSDSENRDDGAQTNVEKRWLLVTNNERKGTVGHHHRDQVIY
jgi:hypothetical protein